MLIGDYNAYMDAQQEINLKIYRKFEEEGVEFAYPTQTLFVDSEIKTVQIRPPDEDAQ